MPASLHLNLRREYFAQIAARTKQIEFRATTPYWRRRLEERVMTIAVPRNKE